MEGTRVAWWNARQWSGAGEKWTWLRLRLASEGIDVMFVIECALDVKQALSLNDRASKAGYEMRRLPGELEGCAGGIVALIRKATTRWDGKSLRLAAKVYAIRVRCMERDTELKLACIHGDEEHGLEQIRAIRNWARDSGRVTVLGDWNATPCKTWRCSAPALTGFDRAVRKLAEFECDCCPTVEDDAPLHGCVVGGHGASVHPEWTRFNTRGDVWGLPTSRIDYAVELGGSTGWRLEESVAAEVLDEAGATRPLSDHLLQRLWLPGAVQQTRERRPKGFKVGRDGRAKLCKEALAEDLNEGALDFELADAMCNAESMGGSATRPVAKALVQIGRAAEARVERKLRKAAAARLRAGGGFNSAKQRFHDWTAVIQAALTLRASGMRADEVRGGSLYHHKRGLRTHLLEGWESVLRRSRMEADRASRQLKAISNSDNAKLEEGARDLLKIPAEDAEGRQRAAFNMIYRDRGSVVMDGMHMEDSPEAEFVHCTDERFEKVSRCVGELFVGKLDKGFVQAGFDAWLDMFVGKFETVKGLDGLDWEVRKELTFDVFNGVVDSMPVKAVGAGGFSIVLLKQAPERVRRVVWEAMVGDATRATFDPDWKRVMYALLVKPLPNRPDLVHQRREIALMAIEMKLLLQCVRRTCYSRVAGRIHNSAMGWLATYGCTDLGICAAHVTDQARVLKHELYLLYVDLATFFPKIQRGPLRAAKLAHGLPRVVIDLAGLIYGRYKGDPGCVTCHYDTAAGLGGGFANHMGSLMGCVLSTEDARIFLNSLITAIFAVARGVRLWGYAESDRDATWEELCQLVLADDWLGCFTRVKEVRRAWAMLSTWEPCSGAEIGIKAAAKTVLTGVRWDADGKPKPIGFLRLCTADGRVVPIVGAHEAYKHLGRMRRADGSCFAERQAFFKKVKHACALIRGMRRPSRFALILVSEALLTGLAGFYLQTLHITWAEAEKLEAIWRSAANKALRRKRDTPRLEFYLPGRGRTHLFATNLTAKIGASCRAMSDLSGTPQRGAARSALAMASARWGCCEDPGEWEIQPIAEELEKTLEHAHHRTFGEGWLLAWALCEQSLDQEQEGLENYHYDRPRFIMLDGDAALSASARHFEAPRSSLLFDRSKGLGIPIRAAVVRAGVLCVGHLCMRRVDGCVELMSSKVASANGVELNSVADRVAWDETVELVRAKVSSSALTVERRRDIRRAWQDGKESGVGVDLAAIGKLKERLLAEAGKQRQDVWDPSPVHARTYARKEWWDRTLRAAITNVPPPSTVEWKHGLNGGSERSAGPKVVRTLLDGSRRCQTGAEEWWHKQGSGWEVGADGWYLDWREREEELRDRFQVDDQGYVCWDGGVRISAQECRELPPLIQLHTRARLALGEGVKLTAGPPTKAAERRVNVDLAATVLWDACTWQARLRITEAYTLDGGKVEVEAEKKSVVYVVAYALIKHDGTKKGGVISDSRLDPFVGNLDLPGTSYLAELAAQVRAAQEAEDGGRVFILYDAQSPEAAVNSYRRAHARRAREMLGRGWLSEVCVQERRLQLKAYGWQTSHVGAPHNEWVDAEVERQAQGWNEHARGLHATYDDATSVRFPQARKSMLQWAKPRADRLVCDRLRLTVRNTIYPRDDDAKLGKLNDEQVGAINAAAARRWAIADEGGGGRPEDRARRAALKCPAGCAAKCDSYHFIYECQDCELVEDRVLLQHELWEAIRLAELQCFVAVHDDGRAASDMLRAGIAGDGCIIELRTILVEATSEKSEAVRTSRNRRDALTRTMAGMFYGGTGGKAIRAAATELAKLTARMLKRGHQVTALLHKETVAREKAQRVFRKYARKLAALIDQAGTRRAAFLRQAQVAEGHVWEWHEQSGAILPVYMSDARVPEVRQLVERARETRLPSDEKVLQACSAWIDWWASARLLGWRLRARRSTVLLQWIDEVAEWHEGVAQLVEALEGHPHGDNVRRAHMGVLRLLSKRERREHVPEAKGREEAIEVRDPEALRSWAARLAQTQLTWTPRATLEEFEERLRSRAVSAGRRERRLRKLGRAELQLRPQLETGLDRWQQEANPATASGAVRRPPGTWDVLSTKVTRRIAKRLRGRDHFRAAKGEAADRDETWGFDRVERVRVQLPARYAKSKVVLEALLVWRGEWGDEQTKWTPATKAYFPKRAGKAQMAAITARFEAEQGRQHKRQKTAVAAPIVQGKRRQPDRIAKAPRARADRLTEADKAARKAERSRRRLTAANVRAVRTAANTDATIGRIQRRHDEFKRRAREEGSESDEQDGSKRLRGGQAQI
jgi:hypothetical protein